MDPEEALRQARQAAHTLMQSAPGSDPAAIANIADLLASAFTDLDEWLTKGGFLREVICEIAEERALIERMLRSAVVQNFMDQAATRLAAEPPVAIRFAQPPPGFTKAGWDRLNEKRQGS
jgi:hypothetical protein